MSTGDDATITNTSEEPRRIETHFIKSNLFRVIHVDGAWGGLTPQMNIQIALYSERTPIPQQVIYEATAKGLVDVERTGRQGIVREVEADIIVSLDVARSLVKWLQGKIDEAAEPADLPFQIGNRHTSGIEIGTPIPLSVIPQRPGPLPSYFETGLYIDLARVYTNGTADPYNAAEIEGISQTSAVHQIQEDSPALAKQLASIRELPENWDYAGARKYHPQQLRRLRIGQCVHFTSIPVHQ